MKTVKSSDLFIHHFVVVFFYVTVASGSNARKSNLGFHMTCGSCTTFMYGLRPLIATSSNSSASISSRAIISRFSSAF